MPARFRRLRKALIKRERGDRWMANILALLLHHDETLVEKTVRDAIDSNVISKTHILNQLSRVLDAPWPEALTPPPTLTLREELEANTTRYDNRRDTSHVR